MARPRKNDSKDIIALTEIYYTNVIAGDVSKLKYSLLAEYLESCGIKVEAYNLRRDAKLVAFIEKMKEEAAETTYSMSDISYKTLDIDELLSKCHDLKTLRRTLEELDAYWKGVYQKSDLIIKADRKLKAEYESLIKETNELRERLENEHSILEKTRAEMDLMKKENVYCKGQIRKYIYPAIANEIMRNMNLPAKENEAVNTVAFSDFIEEARPTAYEGIQKKSGRKLSREEVLLKQMREQIET